MTMRVAGILCALVFVLAVVPPARSNEYYEKYYSDPGLISVERDGKIVNRVPCERIPLDYPDLGGRGEGHVALDSKGHIWAAIGYNVGGEGIERLFHSRDGGRTWASQTLSPTKDSDIVGFAVLRDDTMLMALNNKCEDVEVWSSHDMGESWQIAATLSGAPLKCIGEGTMSLTQLRDGRVFFPVGRYTHPSEDLVLDKLLLLHSVYVSTDGGQTFPVAYSTFPDVCESHVLELQSGKLLGTFRYQRLPFPGETEEELAASGGKPKEGRQGKDKRAFKHVFVGDSDDGGANWKNFRPVRDKQGQALIHYGECYGRLAQVPDGRVVLVHDRRYPYENGEGRARVSQDGGQTWGREIYHLSRGHGYPSSVVLKDGTIVTITGNGLSQARGGPKGPRTVQVIRWKLP